MTTENQINLNVRSAYIELHQQTILKNLRTKLNKTIKPHSIKTTGFYNLYLKELETSKTKIKAFNVVNENVRVLTGKKFYQTFEQFQNAIYE